MNKQQLILIGGGGHCKSCIDIIENDNNYEILGILDLPSKLGEKILNYSVIGTDEDIDYFIDKNCAFLITLGQIKSAKARKFLFEKLKSLDAKIPTIVSSHAYVSKYASLGEGTIVMHNAFINASAFVGNNCIINTGAIIEHDVKIGNHSHISTNAVINGDCVVGDEVFVGSKSVVSNQIRIKGEVIIGAGTTVIRDIERNNTVAGVPAKKI
jgi:sugar O-acyltransferase (sialic acid O-acetyltransferase NeuD family)